MEILQNNFQALSQALLKLRADMVYQAEDDVKVVFFALFYDSETVDKHLF